MLGNMLYRIIRNVSSNASKCIGFNVLLPLPLLADKELIKKRKMRQIRGN